MLPHPFDRDCRIEAAGFGEFDLCLGHFASMRVGGREVRVEKGHLQTHVERLAVFVNRCVEMAEIVPRRPVNVPKSETRVARA